MADGIRIIGGEGCGRYIKSFKDDLSVRPLLGRIKKSLFDILKLKIMDSVFLDLYAGTGAVGIEAISRGAGKVIFVDGDRKCTELVSRNLADLGWQNRGRVEQFDITRGLKWLGEKIDIVYMGPPYKDLKRTPLTLTGVTLKTVVEADILKSNSLIISQRHIKEPVAVPEELESIREEKYGDTLVVFYRKRKA